MTDTLYFGYGTYLDDAESSFYLPDAQKLTLGTAFNRKFEFHAHEGALDRGYCHITDKIEAFGNNVRGIIFRHHPKYFVDYPGFERCFVTVYGDDGKMYECWTLRMSKPGAAVRPPDYYWEHVTRGMQICAFPKNYADGIVATYNAALACTEADRPNPNEGKKSFFS